MCFIICVIGRDHLVVPPYEPQPTVYITRCSIGSNGATPMARTPGRGRSIAASLNSVRVPQHPALVRR